MFEIRDDTENGIIRVAYIGEIKPTDFETIAPTLKKILKMRNLILLLLDWTRLSGWSDDSESQAFFIRKGLRGHIKRVAIVGESKWRSAATEFG